MKVSCSILSLKNKMRQPKSDHTYRIGIEKYTFIKGIDYPKSSNFPIMLYYT